MLGYYFWKAVSNQNVENRGSGKASEWKAGYEKSSHMGPQGVTWVICGEYVPACSTQWRQALRYEAVWLLPQHLASDKSITDRRRTLFLWGQRLTHFPLHCSKHKDQSQSPLPRNHKQLWEPCPSESGMGKIYLRIFIHYSFKSVLCKDPLKADEK